MKKILVTEDDADTNEILCRLLKIAGYCAVGARDGEQALAMLAGQRPDLVILDMMMPGIDGIEVLRRLRSDPAAATLPVIMYSALSDPKFQDHARQKGATDYCVKGLTDFKALAEMIGKYA
jgi:CheY-like chemotaxis protein